MVTCQSHFKKSIDQFSEFESTAVDSFWISPYLMRYLPSALDSGALERGSPPEPPEPPPFIVVAGAQPMLVAVRKRTESTAGRQRQDVQQKDTTQVVDIAKTEKPKSQKSPIFKYMFYNIFLLICGWIIWLCRKK